MPPWLTAVVALASALVGGGGALWRARSLGGRDRASTEVILQRATAAAIANVQLAADQARASALAARDEANNAHADAETSRRIARESAAAAAVAQGQVRYLEAEVAQLRVQLARTEEQMADLRAQLDRERAAWRRRYPEATGLGELVERRNGV